MTLFISFVTGAGITLGVLVGFFLFGGFILTAIDAFCNAREEARLRREHGCHGHE
ncbi:MAG TPA: hypothetical protein VF614_02280 [Chthoniobacteraceae bacterium]|jgi:hypothetical protein